MKYLCAFCSFVCIFPIKKQFYQILMQFSSMTLYLSYQKSAQDFSLRFVSAQLLGAGRYEMRVTKSSLFYYFLQLVVIVLLAIENLLLPPIPSIKAQSIKTKYQPDSNRRPLKFEMRVT